MRKEYDAAVQFNPEAKPPISDESIRNLLAVLMYGGNQNSVLLIDNVAHMRYIKETVRNLWEDMEKFAISPSLETLRGFLEAFCRSKNKKMVKSVHESMIEIVGAQKQKLSYRDREALICAHAICENHEEVVKLFDEFDQSKLKITRAIFENGLRSLAALEKHSRVLNIFPKISLTHLICPTNDILEIILTSLVKACPKQDQNIRIYLKNVTDFVNKTLKIKRNNDVHIITRRAYKPLIEAYIRYGMRKQALHEYFVLKSIFETDEAAKINTEIQEIIPGTEIHRKILMEVRFMPLSLIANILELTSFLSAPDLSEAVSFFESEVLLKKDRVLSRWLTLEKKWRENHELKITSAEKVANSIPRQSPRHVEAVEIVDTLRGALDDGLPVRVGLNGPFSACYIAIYGGFRMKLEKRLAADGKITDVFSVSEINYLAEKIKYLMNLEREIVAEVLQPSQIIYFFEE
ncbi:hypothetical protein HK100_006407 [Physocladia obscura]|uniref:Uncharacterized protein n=1 Tax=Physocladia obscura TaxID=109957 RepID=A0AAD5SQH3_9FUNG|nr:hypothetical protein HK100_006407 [Physocladia obscura]